MSIKRTLNQNNLKNNKKFNNINLNPKYNKRSNNLTKYQKIKTLNQSMINLTL